MSEDEARQWIIDRFGVPRGTLLNRYASMLIAASGRQNLISAASVNALWSRHLLDSAQLIHHSQDASGAWMDVGSGGGLPGLVIAVLSDRPVILVEPRRKRAAFLEDCAAELGLTNRVIVHCRAVERLTPLGASVISARAVAPLDRLLAGIQHQLTLTTVCIFPKGRTAESEVATARETWHGDFQLMPSVTDPDARIVLIRRAAPR